MISTKDLSGLPNAERLKNFCKGLAALDIIMVEEEWNFIRHYTYDPAWRKADGQRGSFFDLRMKQRNVRRYVTLLLLFALVWRLPESRLSYR